MGREEIKSAVLSELGSVAPELNPSTLDPAEPIRDQIDIDSIDYLHLIEALSRRFGRDIPERDYPKLSTLNGLIDYLDVDAKKS